LFGGGDGVGGGCGGRSSDKWSHVEQRDYKNTICKFILIAFNT
jgi:hypothetical protein